MDYNSGIIMESNVVHDGEIAWKIGKYTTRVLLEEWLLWFVQ